MHINPRGDHECPITHEHGHQEKRPSFTNDLRGTALITGGFYHIIAIVRLQTTVVAVHYCTREAVSYFADICITAVSVHDKTSHHCICIAVDSSCKRDYAQEQVSCRLRAPDATIRSAGTSSMSSSSLAAPGSVNSLIIRILWRPLMTIAQP